MRTPIPQKLQSESSDAIDLAKRIVERRKLSVSLPKADPKSIELFFLDLGVALSKNPTSPLGKEFVSGYSVPNRRISGMSFACSYARGNQNRKLTRRPRLSIEKGDCRLPVVSLQSKKTIESTRNFNPENGAEMTQPRPSI